MPLMIGVPRGAKIVPGSETAAAVEAGNLVLMSAQPVRKRSAAPKKSKTAEKKPRKPPAPPPVRRMVMMRPVAMGTIVPSAKPATDPNPSVIKIESSEPSDNDESQIASTSHAPTASSTLSANVDEPSVSRKRKRTLEEDDALKKTKRVIGVLFECMDRAIEFEKEGARSPNVSEFYRTVSGMINATHRQFDDYIQCLEEDE